MPKEEQIDAVFGEYTGKKRFEVSHPQLPSVMLVATPDENAAMVAAADKCGIRWQSYSYYPYVEVREKR